MSFLGQMYTKAVLLNYANISKFIDRVEVDGGEHRALDIGCYDGEITMSLLGNKGFSSIAGVDKDEVALKKASKLGINAKMNDANDRIIFPDSYFDVILSNQVIEHLNDSDKFLEEVTRLLKPGGYAIISTENASSWCNIFASVMGWQIFSLTNFSNKKVSIGNPLSLHKSLTSRMYTSAWVHTRIYNIYGLQEYLEVCGFKIEGVAGAGYFPLPAALGNIDKTHAHFITFKARKPKNQEN